MTNRATTPIRARVIVAVALLAGALALAGCTARVTFDPSSLAPESVSTTAGAGYLIARRRRSDPIPSPVELAPNVWHLPLLPRSTVNAYLVGDVLVRAT